MGWEKGWQGGELGQVRQVRQVGPPGGWGCKKSRRDSLSGKATAFLSLESELYALELEGNGEGVPYVHRMSVHLAGDEVGESLNHAHSFLVEVGVL